MVDVGVSVTGLIERAKRAAQRRGQRMSTAHLLLVMLQSDTEVSSLLSKHGVRESALLTSLSAVDTESSSSVQRAVENSQRLANTFGATEVSTEHLLLAMTRDTRSAAHRSLHKMGRGTDRLQRRLLEHFGARNDEPTTWLTKAPSNSTLSDSRRSFTPPRRKRPIAKARPRTHRESKPNPPVEQRPKNTRVAPATQSTLGPFDLDPKQFPLLTTIGKNLTAAAADGRIDPVIGRESEVELLLDILARRRSNNPILVGSPGVGKTAVVEAMALRMSKGVEVDGLSGKVVIEVSAGGLVSGTGVRGALSDRVRMLREEVTRSAGRVILFIDEIHAIVGAESGPDDLAHELKAALARGELPCVGATTEVEYRRYFEKDAALARRFSPVRVEEPSEEDAIAILRGVSAHYEEHHGVTYDEDALTAAVRLTARYVTDRFLPDKAVSVIDLAAARVRRRSRKAVDEHEIAVVVAEQTGISADRLLLRDADRLLRLEELLAERVVGHVGVRERIGEALRKAAAGLRGTDRPMGTFLLLGPTGVGKTEMAKAVSEIFFPGSEPTRIDMSELSEAHGVARLIGAPPGYIGHDAGGRLTESVRRRPYQLILLDEVEKAHPDVLMTLLPLLDEGRLTDGRGRTVDFSHTIIMMTSNLGVVSERSQIGFSKGAGKSNAVLEAARKSLPPELWNRIDEPLYFSALSRENVCEIASRILLGLQTRLLKERGVALSLSDEVTEALAEAGGFDPEYGARPMKRVIARLIESPVASAILRHPDASAVDVFVEDAQIVVKASAPPAANFGTA